MKELYGFLFAMWILILVGGGIVVIILGPIAITGFGELDWLVTSAIQGGIAVSLVIIWIFILLKIKNWIFKKEIRS